MTTVRRVLALTALTVALAAAVEITGDRSGPRVRPLLVPGLRFDDLVGLELVAGDRPPVTLALDGGRVRITAPVAAAADERAVRDLISAIATARFDHVAGAGAWHRAGLDLPVAVVRLRRPTGATTELRVGVALAASGQTWLAVDRRPGLVPSWVADALVRDPDNLRRRRPFPAAAVIAAIEAHGPGLDLVLADRPLRRRDAGVKVALDPARRERLLERLAALTVEVAVDAPRTAAGLTVRVLGAGEPAELTGTGPCPGHPELRVVETNAGVGCVAATALDDLAATVRDLTGPAAIATAPIERFDRTTVAALELGGTPPVRLEPDGGGWRLAIGDRRVTVDDALARAVAAALTAPATVIPASDVGPAGPAAGAPLERWRLRRPAGEVETWEVRRAPTAVTVRREREPVVLVLAATAAATVRTIGPGLRDRGLVAIEPIALAAIEARGAAPATLERGALIDEWHVVAPPGATAGAAVSALRDRLAALRAVAWLAPGALGPVRRTVRLAVDGGPGQPAQRTIVLELGRPRATGCAVRVDGGDVAQLAAADCAALAAPLVRP